MKILLRLVVVLLATWTVRSFYTLDKSLDQLFDKWKTKYSKKYGNVTEEVVRRLLWESSVRQVMLNQMEYEFGIKDTKMDLGEYADMTPEEISDIVSPSTNSNTTATTSAPTITTEDALTKVDAKVATSRNITKNKKKGRRRTQNGAKGSNKQGAKNETVLKSENGDRAKHKDFHRKNDGMKGRRPQAVVVQSAPHVILSENQGKLVEDLGFKNAPTYQNGTRKWISTTGHATNDITLTNVLDTTSAPSDTSMTQDMTASSTGKSHHIVRHHKRRTISDMLKF